MTVRLVAAVCKERPVNFWTGRSQPSANGIYVKIPAEVTADVGPDGQNGRRPGPAMGDLVANGRADRQAWFRPAQMIVRPSLA
jgi:hypothetical protein